VRWSKHGNLSSAFLCIRDLITKYLANQHCKYYSIASYHAQGKFKLEINRRWRLAAARVWTSLLIGRIHVFVLGFDDKTTLGAQEGRRQIYYSHVRNGHGNGHRSNGRG
jgi:hypothetical protein